ncbi:SDR family oxidoreductase [Fibrisoma montanum]|uniref:SDR family oxidoreductase n=1 Tax=Fibrisoma montanum TaxID=2305895 RepID=A0A418M6P2_9BACT|nr:SDR family oxidoreductase [Fibrisoma montanum]RIV21553.1 SDR family oxidoreductase [Fibrisoma montanum]
MTTEVGKTALITGATSGIGKELATLFAKDGYNLILVARQEDKLHEVAEQFRQQYGTSNITVVESDLSKSESPQQVYDEVKRQGLTVNVLVNNAGIGEHGKFATETDLQKELGIIQLNIASVVQLTKLFTKEMVERNEGKILMLGSIASVLPNPLMAVYGATKSFIYSFSEALRNELKDTNVTVTVLMPGATDTDFFNKAGAMNTKAQEQARSTNPADVAKTGYEALMAGKDKVVHGLMNKVQVAGGYVLPDQVVTSNVRKLMEDKDSSQKQEDEKTSALALGIGIASVVVAGIVIAAMYRNTSPYDRARYRYKAGKALGSVKNAVASVGDSANGAYHNAKADVEQALV